MSKGEHSSESVDWGTPKWVIELARKVMGGIGLDPASSETHNRRVRATRFITSHGLQRTWLSSSLWLNPPYCGQTAEWVRSFIEAAEETLFDQGMLLVNAHPGRKWFQPLWHHRICFFHKRIQFINGATGEPCKQPTQHNALVYIGPRRALFSEVFGPHGEIIG